jgi:hypothetical protein
MVLCFAIVFPVTFKKMILVTEWIMLSPLITDIFWKLVIANRFNYRLEKATKCWFRRLQPRTASFLIQIKGPHSLISHIVKNYLNIILPSTFWFPKIEFFLHFFRPMFWKAFSYLICNVSYINGPYKQMKWNLKVYTVRVNSRSDQCDRLFAVDQKESAVWDVEFSSQWSAALFKFCSYLWHINF